MLLSKAMVVSRSSCSRICHPAERLAVWHQRRKLPWWKTGQKQSQPGDLPSISKVNQSHSKVTIEKLLDWAFQHTKQYLVTVYFHTRAKGDKQEIQLVKVPIWIIPPKQTKTFATLPLVLFFGWVFPFGWLFYRFCRWAAAQALRSETAPSAPVAETSWIRSCDTNHTLDHCTA